MRAGCSQAAWSSTTHHARCSTPALQQHNHEQQHCTDSWRPDHDQWVCWAGRGCARALAAQLEPGPCAGWPCEERCRCPHSKSWGGLCRHPASRQTTSQCAPCSMPAPGSLAVAAAVPHAPTHVSRCMRASQLGVSSTRSCLASWHACTAAMSSSRCNQASTQAPIPADHCPAGGL